MDKYTPINKVLNDQSIISGLGFSSALDISLDNFSEREPNAASTAASIKRREGYLLSYPDKENNYVELSKSGFPITQEKKTEVLQDITHAKNVPENYLDFKENILSNSTENVGSENNNVDDHVRLSGRSSSESSGFNLYGSSSILAHSNLISFDEEIDELDLKKVITGASHPQGLPSYAIGNANDQVNKEFDSYGIWDDDDETQEDDPHDEETNKDNEELDLKGEVDDQHKRKVPFESLPERGKPFTGVHSQSINPFKTTLELNQDGKGSAIFLNDLAPDENDEFKDEEFHSLNYNYLDNEEEAFNKNKFLMISNESYSDRSDLSGFFNPKDISVQPSLWNIGNDMLTKGQKLNVEDILTAKSEKLGSLGGHTDEMPSFGFEKSYLRSPPKLVKDYYLNDMLKSTSTNTSEISDKIPSSSFPKPVDHKVPSIKVNDSSYSFEEESSIVERDETVRPSLPEATKNDESSITNSTDYMTLLRAIVERAAKSGDPKQLVEEMLRCSVKEPTLTSESLLDMSTDVKEMKNYRLLLQKGSDISDLHKKSQPLEKQDAVVTDDKEQYLRDEGHVKVKDRMEKGAHNLPLPITTESQHPQQSQCEAVASIKCSQLNSASLSGNSNSIQVITKSCVTDIKTVHESLVRNPTSTTRIVSINKINEIFKFSSSQTVRQNFYSFDYDSSYYLNPNSYIRIPFGFCSLLPGLYKVKLELKMFEMGSSNALRCILTKIVELNFDVRKPNVGIACDKSDCIDFGLVPEFCTAKKEIELINHSNSSLPVLINLKNLCDSNEILSWGSDQPHLKLLSSTLAACELPEQSVINIVVQLQAPSIEVLKANGIVRAESTLEMLLDTPDSSSRVLAQVPIKVCIGEVLLRTLKSKIPLTVKSVVGECGSLTFSLCNKSLFTLHLSVKICGHKSLNVTPGNFEIHSQEDMDVQINFSPTLEMENAKIEGKLLITVNPNGLQMDLPIVAQSCIPDTAQQNFIFPSSAPLDLNVLDSTLQKGIESLPVEVQSAKSGIANREEKALITQSVRLSGSATRCVFGTVSVGKSNTRTLILQNGWTDNILQLQLLIKDSDEFYFVNENGKEKLYSKDVEIGPKEKLSVVVNFAPTEIRLFTGSLVCKCKGVSVPSKTVFPLYGFGGSGILTLTQGDNDVVSEDLSFGKVVSGTPCLLKISASNSGSRFIFVKFRILSDEFSDNSISFVDICVQPPEFVLGPGESKDLIVLTTGAPNIMRLAPGRIAYLQAIYGDEILRKRFRSLKNKTVKWRRVNDPRLMKINFDDFIQRERNALTEVDDCPSFSEDSLTFYNSCKISSIALSCEVDADAEISASMINLDLDQDTLCSFSNASVVKFQPKEAIRTNERVTNSTLNSEFDVFPPQLRLTTSQKTSGEISLVNFSDIDQILEVSCEHNWLNISPKEFTLPPRAFKVIQVQVLAGILPRNTPKINHTSFQILGHNCQREVKIILEIDSQITKEFPLSSKIPLHVRKPTNQSASSVGAQKQPPESGRGFELLANAGKLKTSQRLQTDNKVSKIEIGDELSFPTTRVFKESASKLTINNFGSIGYQIRIVASCNHFYVRHTNNITLKGKHSNQVPIYFHPKETGELIESISVHVLESKQSYQVKLRGNAV